MRTGLTKQEKTTEIYFDEYENRTYQAGKDHRNLF